LLANKCLPCSNKFGSNCATCTPTQCSTCSNSKVLEVDGSSCISAFTDCTAPSVTTLTSLNPKTGKLAYRCTSCNTGFAWNDELWECVECNSRVSFCTACNDNTFACTACLTGLIPDLNGERCSYDFTQLTGSITCPDLQSLEVSYDPITKTNRYSCTCAAGYSWDNMTWTCTKTPGVPFCSASTNGVCTGCTSNSNFPTTFNSTDNKCYLTNC